MERDVDTISLSMEEYGALHADSVPPGTEASKDDVIARWADRYEKLRVSSGRQLSELSAEVGRLTARVAVLEGLLQDAGISYDSGGLGLQDALAALTSGVKPVREVEGVTEVAVAAPPVDAVPTGSVLTCAGAAAAALSGLHGAQNIIAVCVAGRVRELEDMPVVVVTGGADKRCVVSLFLPDTGVAVPAVASLSLPAPVLDIVAHPASLSYDMDAALCAIALMDGSVALVTVAVDLSVPVKSTDRPAFAATLVHTRRDHNKFVTRAKWSPDGTVLAVCSQDGGVTTYSVHEPSSPSPTLTKLNTQQFTSGVEAIEFVTVSEGPLAVSGVATEYIVCAVRASPTLYYINTKTLAYSRVGISEDSGVPVAASASAPDAAFTRVGFTVLDLAVSPDSRFLCVSTDHGLHFLYKPGTSVIVKRLVGHTVNEMSSVRVAWHPTGQYVCSTSDRDNCVYVWDVRTEGVVETVCKHSSRVRSLVCWCDQRAGTHAYLVSVSFDRTGLVWPVHWV